ncbi:MAG: transposase family protein [Planctomycetes bacterium]|nr:transposase family protein [Planctomycetota bacterium]
MTSFQLSDLTPLFLVLVTDCFTREIVGWTLDRRCRASEWTSALRPAVEQRGLTNKEVCARLTLRSDNGASSTTCTTTTPSESIPPSATEQMPLTAH